MATSSDVRAIMGIPAAPPPGEKGAAAPAKSRHASSSKLKKAKRPDGITRELYALIGDNAPTLSLARPVMKERWKKTPKIIGWEKREFLNKARSDSLKLKHWIKKDQPADTGLLSFPFYLQSVLFLNWETQNTHLQNITLRRPRSLIQSTSIYTISVVGLIVFLVFLYSS